MRSRVPLFQFPKIFGSRPRFHLALLLSCVATSLSRAQVSPKQSATVLVGVHQVAGFTGSISVAVNSTVPGEANPYSNTTTTSNTNPAVAVQSPNAVFRIVPGRMYELVTYSPGFFGPNLGAGTPGSQVDTHFNVPPGYSIYVGPPYYPKRQTSTLTAEAGGNTPSTDEQFYILPNDGSQTLAAGYSTNPRINDVIWAISAGRLSSGGSAGSLSWASTTVDQSLLDASALNYTFPSWSNELVYNYADGAIKYIGAPQVQLYVRRNSGTNSGYVVEVYDPTVVPEPPSNDPTQDNWSFSASPTMTYTVSNPDSTWLGRVQIVRVNNSNGGSVTDTWILNQSGGTTSITQASALRVVSSISSANTPISGERTEDVTIKDNTNTVALKRRRIYKTFPWNEELISDIADPDGAALTTTYDYYNTTSGDGHYTKLKSVTRPNGSWTLYDYYDDYARWGQLAGLYTPFQNSPTTAAAATQSNCRFVSYDYNTGLNAFQENEAGHTTQINGVIVQKQVISSTFAAIGGYDVDDGFLFGQQHVRIDTIQDYSASGTYQTTVRKIVDPETSPEVAGKLYSQINPDGTMTSVSHEPVSVADYSATGANYNFTQYDNNAADPRLYWLDVYYTGTASQQDPAAVQLTLDGVPGPTGTNSSGPYSLNPNGIPIEPIWLTPYKSYRTWVAHDEYGNVQMTQTSVFTGGTPVQVGGSSTFQWVSWQRTPHEANGLLDGAMDGTGAVTTNSYNDGKLSYTKDASGKQVQNYFDAIMRVTRSEQKGVGGISGFPAQSAIETNYTYDAAGHVLTTSTQAQTGGVTYTTSAAYDLAGRVTSQTDERGLVTTTAYSNNGLTVTVTAPGSATTITNYNLDGSVASVTGTAQVPSYNTVSVAVDGKVTATTHSGTSTSPRYSSTTADWFGRTIAQSTPAFGGGTFTKTSSYNTLGQLTETTQPGLAATLYKYDNYGDLQYTGLDAEGTGSLDLSGNTSERVTETRQQIVSQGGAFWNQTLSYAFAQSGSATPTLIAETDQKLSPYAGNLGDFAAGRVMTQVNSYDFYRNLTVSTGDTDRVDALTTTQTTYANSSTPAVTKTYNGHVVSQTTKEGITTTSSYDGLGELVGITDPRKGTSTVSYYSSGTGAVGQVNQQADAAGDTTTFTYSSTDGRLSSSTDSASNVVYHGYDHQGREIKTWGNGTYPVAYAYDQYGAKIAMRTFRDTGINFSGSSWPLSDDGGDSQNPDPSVWASGDKTSWTYDTNSGLLTSKTDASAHSVGYTYTSSGKLSVRTWTRGVSTTYAYDANTGDQTGITYSDSTPAVSYSYDRLGHATSIVQNYGGTNVTTGLSYNAVGKQTQETFDSTYFAGRIINWTLDSASGHYQGRTIGYNVAASAGNEFEASYDYDGFGRLDHVGMTSGPTFSYGFLANSNLVASVTDSADYARAETWHSNRDVLDSIETDVSAVNFGKFAYLYDALGRRTSKVSTGTLFARYPAAGLTDAYGYDTRSELTSAQTYQSVNATSPTTPMLGRGYSYTFDPIGNRITSGVDSNSTTYTSNSLNEIMSRTVPGYYAASGLAPTGSSITLNGTAVVTAEQQGQYFLRNVPITTNASAPVWSSTSVSSSLGGSFMRNAWIPQTPESYSYDLDGNVLSDGRWHYTWDGENRLTSMETVGHQSGDSTLIWASGVPKQHIDFRYDYLGRRISKAVSTWNGSAFASTSESRFIYNHWNLVSDYAVSGGTLVYTHGYLWGLDLSGSTHGAGGVGGLLAEQTASGTIQLPIYDGNGNIDGLVDRSTGGITAAYEYSPFGETLRSTGADAQVNPFRFSSKFTDDETQDLYYGYRYYNPSLGRFLGRDGVEEKGGLHLYAFVANNAVNASDSLGHSPMAQNDSIPVGPLSSSYLQLSDDGASEERAEQEALQDQHSGEDYVGGDEDPGYFGASSSGERFFTDDYPGDTGSAPTLASTAAQNLQGVLNFDSETTQEALGGDPDSSSLGEDSTPGASGEQSGPTMAPVVTRANYIGNLDVAIYYSDMSPGPNFTVTSNVNSLRNVLSSIGATVSVRKGVQLGKSFGKGKGLDRTIDVGGKNNPIYLALLALHAQTGVYPVIVTGDRLVDNGSYADGTTWPGVGTIMPYGADSMTLPHEFGHFIGVVHSDGQNVRKGRIIPDRYHSSLNDPSNLMYYQRIRGQVPDEIYLNQARQYFSHLR